MRNGYQGIRLTIDGPELECKHCGEFWPIDVEHWVVDRTRGLRPSSCRNCERERAKLYQAIRRQDPTFAAKDRDKCARYRHYIKRSHPTLLEAYDREKRAEARQRSANWRARRVA